jgi:homoserine O-succinyltransferase
VNDVNTVFDVPHSRFNEIGRDQFEAAGLHVLVESEEAGVHLAVSEDGMRVVYFQGHPEYDTISLLKEYKREVTLFAQGKREDYPPFPENYLSRRAQAILDEYRDRLLTTQERGAPMPEFPEELIANGHGKAGALDNTWHDTAEAVIDNWIGQVYQVTNHDRKLPFMAGIDPDDPLGWRR